MHVQNLMNSLWDIRIFLGLVPKESPCIIDDNVGFQDYGLPGCNECQGTTLTIQADVACKMLLPDHHTTQPRL